MRSQAKSVQKEALYPGNTRWYSRIPSPFSIAFWLTLIVAIWALLGGEAPDLEGAPAWRQLLQSWDSGLWNRGGLVFAFQMMLILVLGHSLALSAPVKRLLNALLSGCRSTPSAAAVVAIASISTGLINWGFGLICGAVLARQVAEKALREGWGLHYPLIGAAGYTGMMVWHGGFSGSAPITVNTPDHTLVSLTGVIPLSETLATPMNAFVTISALILLPLLCWFLGRRALRSGQIREPEISPPVSLQKFADSVSLPSSSSRNLMAYGAGLALLLLCVLRFIDTPEPGSLRFLTLDFINLFLFGTALLLHGSVDRFVQAVEKAMPGAAGIALQFPLYFGIMGIMTDFGLIADLAQAFIAISAPQTFPLFAFLSAALVNLFVPSGGGQWQVQGPMLMQAAMELGAPAGKTVMALAYGDQLTNMLQPFWALPLLGITGLSARSLLPYTALFLLAGLVIFATALLLF